MVSCTSPKQKPKGIIALTPSLAETVLSLQNEQPDESWPLIATTKYFDQPETNHLPKLDTVGSLETITSLNPALVLLHSSDHILAQKLNQIGIKTQSFDMDTIPEIERAISEIGQITGHSDQSHHLIEATRRERNQIQAEFAQKTSNPPKILVIVDRLDTRMQQLYVAQKPAYLAELIEDCGFESIQIKTAQNAWMRMDAESLIALDPDYLVYFARDKKDAEEVMQSFESLYPTLSAIKNHRLFVYDDPKITVPGPNLFKRASKLCHFLKKQ